jgi:hypothetical protein
MLRKSILFKPKEFELKIGRIISVSKRKNYLSTITNSLEGRNFFYFFWEGVILGVKILPNSLPSYTHPRVEREEVQSVKKNSLMPELWQLLRYELKLRLY